MKPSTKKSVGKPKTGSGLEAFTPDSRNSNRGTLRGAGFLEQSLRKFGAGRSIFVDKNGKIIGGNKTHQQALELGMGAKLVDTDGNTLVVVRRNDIDLDTPQGREMAIADNRVGEINLEWVGEELAGLKDEGVDVGSWFFDDELGKLLPVSNEGLTDPDDAPFAPDEPVSRLKDLWVLGKHRLLCGDSTVATDVERALCGVKPHLMVTDPPYGVGYDPAWRVRLGVNLNQKKLGAVKNDDRVDWREAWALFPGDVVYVWHADRHASAVQASVEAAGFEIRCQIIWAKDRLVMSRGHYHWQHEPCWYAVRSGATGHWGGDRKQTTLWTIPARDDSGHGHSTQKPVECMKRPIENNSSPGQAVYEPFSGSGTTIIAAETTGRSCHAIELHPPYVDVAVLRWQAFTGQQATLDGGETFDALSKKRKAA